MIENAHKHLQLFTDKQQRQPDSSERQKVILDACREVGGSLFFSLLIITVSFLPIFALQGQQGRLFEPLAYTKTLAMACAALLSITLIPVLIVLRGKIPSEEGNYYSRISLVLSTCA